MTDVGASGSILHFVRRAGDEVIFCAFNLGHEPARWTCPKARGDRSGPNSEARRGAGRQAAPRPVAAGLSIRVEA